MTNLKDGGPAFPHLNPNFDGNWDREPQRGGMSLRDWFAGQALTISGDRTTATIAQNAFKVADAMLKAREQECDQ